MIYCYLQFYYLYTIFQQERKSKAFIFNILYSIIVHKLNINYLLDSYSNNTLNYLKYALQFFMYQTLIY